MNTIAYLVYGSDPSYALELTYSVLSCARFLHEEPDDVQLALISEGHYLGSELPLKHLKVTQDQLRTWTLGGSYKHAAKYFALAAAMDHFKGSVALVDTDTVFLAHPKLLFGRIKSGASLMHATDRLLSEEPSWKPILDSINKLANGYVINRQSRMYNSGVLGVHHSDRHAIDDVLPLIKELCGIAQVDTIEQFAFTAVLQRYTSLAVCPDLVRHYWGYERRFCHAQIRAFLKNAEVTDLTNYVGPLPTLGYPNKPLVARGLARLKQIWRGASAEYRFAYLAYKCALASTDALIVEAWADTALDILLRHEARNPAIKHDFEQFSPKALARNKSIGQDTRRRWNDYWVTLSP